MSRTNPDENSRLTNPAAPFFEWSGSKGNFSYYDKATESKVEVKLPFTFLPLRRCVTLKGYNDKKKKSFWSNEIKDTQTDKLIIRSKDGTEAEGLYKDLKDFCELNKISYTESLYVAYKTKEGLKLGNIQIRGSALGPWIEFCQKNNPYKVAVSIKKTADGKNGSVSFLMPVYESMQVTEESNKKAIELDGIIAEYLESYFKRAENYKSEPKAEPKTDEHRNAKAPQDSGVTISRAEDAAPIFLQEGEDLEDVPF